MIRFFSFVAALLVCALSLSSNTASAAPCAPGTFSADGQTPCELTPRGTYMPFAGGTQPIEADVGRYADEEGLFDAKTNPAGYFSADTGSILPSPVQGGFFALPGPFGQGANMGTACLPGTASRAGAAFCSAVGPGVGPDLDPIFNSDYGVGITPFDVGEVSMGRLTWDPLTFMTDPLTLSFEIRNDALDFGLLGPLSSDLTLIDTFIVGGQSELFSVPDFVQGLVINEQGAATVTLTINPFDVSQYWGLGTVTTQLIFRTDQGNIFGFDPYNAGFDPTAVDISYQMFRDADFDHLALGSGQTLPLSREFGFLLTASVPAPGALALLGIGMMGLASCAHGRRRKP